MAKNYDELLTFVIFTGGVIWLAHGNRDQEARQSAGQDLRGTRGLRVLWHLQYRGQVRGVQLLINEYFINDDHI